MISKVIYDGSSVNQKEIIKAYINDNDQPQHIYSNRLREWIRRKIGSGNINLERTKESLEDYLKKHEEDVARRAEKMAVGHFTSKHAGRKNRKLRADYPSTEQYRRDVERYMETAIREFKLAYAVSQNAAQRGEIGEWIRKDDTFLRRYNSDHEEAYLTTLSAAFKECEETAKKDVGEKVTDALEKKPLYYEIYEEDDDQWLEDDDDAWMEGDISSGRPDESMTVGVNPLYIDDFIYQFMDNNLQDILSDVQDSVSDNFLRLTGITEEDLSDEKDDAAKKIKRRLETIEDGLKENSGFYDERVLKMIVERNPYYRAAINKLGKEERDKLRLKENILSAMPDTYPKLFPLAREMKRHFILHVGPTNSGKTYAAMERLKEKGSGIYLAPLRLLAFEQYEALNGSGYACSLITGEERSLKEGALIQSSTVEIFDPTKEYDCVVLDEAQMISDKDRGWAWTAVILGICCPEIHVCMAPQAKDIIISLIKECGDTYEEVQHSRKVPLIVDTNPVQSLKSVHPGDALIVFSKRNVHAVAHELKNMDIQASVIYGNLPYDVRQSEAKKFQNGETSVLVSTDAIGMGLNLPIKRVVFLESSKYDGARSRTLTEEEFKQIGGRAGRMGIFDEGHCAICGSTKLLKESMEKKTPAIREAVIGFPKQLLGLKGKLSDIIVQWDSLPVSARYKHSDLTIMRQLSKELEYYTENKQLVYDFVTIPFNEKTIEKELWSIYFFSELKKEYLSFTDVCKKYGINSENDNLSSLEQFHKLCDLAYAYCNRFGHEEDVEQILATKKAISKKIIVLLSEQKLESRKCKYCGKELAWNYPYGMCNGCYASRFRRKSSYDWEEDFEWH